MASNKPQFGQSMWSEIDADIFKNIKDKPVQPSQEGSNLQKSGDANEPKYIDEGFKFNQISSDSQNKYQQQSKQQQDLSGQQKQNPEEQNLPSAMFHQQQQQFDWQAQESSQSQEPEYLREHFQKTQERDFDMEQRLGQGKGQTLSKQEQLNKDRDAQLQANLKWSLGEEQKSFGQGDQPGLQRRDEHLTSPQIDRALKQGLSSEKEEAIQSREPYLQTQGIDKTRFGKQSHDFTSAAQASRGAEFERMEQKKDWTSEHDEYARQLKERKQMEEENERKIEELEQRRMEEHPEQFACVPEILENKRGLDELEHQKFEEDKAAMGIKNVEYRKLMKEVQMKDRERQKQESRQHQQQQWSQNQSAKHFMNKFCDCFCRWMQQKYGLKQGEESLGWDQRWESGFTEQQDQSLMDRFCKCFERKLCDQYGWKKSQGSQLWQQQQQLQQQQQKLQQENVPLDTIGLMEKFGQSLKQQTASRVPTGQEKIEEEKIGEDICRRDWEGQDNMQQFINEGIKDQFIKNQQEHEQESLREQRDLKADKRSSSPERFKMPKQEQIQMVEGDSENEEDFSEEDDDETDQREEQKFEQSQEEKGAIHKDIGLEIKDEDLQFLKEQQKKLAMSGTGGQEGKKKRRKRKAKKSQQEQQEGQFIGEQQHQMKQIETEGGKKMVPSEWFGDQSVLKRKLECTSEEHLLKEPESRVNIEFKDTSLAKQKKGQKEGSAKKQPKKQEQASTQKQFQIQTTQTKQQTSAQKSDIPPSSIQQQQQQQQQTQQWTSEEWRSNSPSAKKKQADLWINQVESNLPKAGTFDLPKNWQQENIAKQNQPSNEPKSNIEQKILERNIQESNEPKENVI